MEEIYTEKKASEGSYTQKNIAENLVFIDVFAIYTTYVRSKLDIRIKGFRASPAPIHRLIK